MCPTGTGLLKPEEEVSAGRTGGLFLPQRRLERFLENGVLLVPRQKNGLNH